MKLAVAVTPKSNADCVTGWVEGANGQRELAVRVRAVPDKGKATKAVCNVLAAFFNVPKSSVECVRGGASRHKIIELPVTPEQLENLEF